MHIFYAVIISLIVGFTLGLIFGDKLRADAKTEEARVKALEAKIRAKL